MRAQVLQDRQSVEDKFDIRINDPLELPALILDRACTDIQYRGSKLSAVFRHLFIKACMNSSVKNILTTVNEGANRIPVMESVGYHFKEADISHRTNSMFKNKSKVLLGTIYHSVFPNAVIASEQILNYKLDTFEIVSDLCQSLSKYIDKSISLTGSIT